MIKEELVTKKYLSFLRFAIIDLIWETLCCDSKQIELSVELDRPAIWILFISPRLILTDFKNGNGGSASTRQIND